MSACSLIIVAAAAPPAAQAGERELTLEQALALAQRTNRDLRAARARLEQSASGIEQAWVALLPQLSAQGKYTHNYREIAVDLTAASTPLFQLADIIRTTGGATNPTQATELAAFVQRGRASLAAQPKPVINKLDQLDFALNLTVPVLVPYAYPALIAARRTHASSEANFAVTEAQLLYTVAQTFFAAAGAQALVAARKHAIEVARETWENAKARFEAGVVNRVEVTRAEVALVRAEQSEAEAEDSQAQVDRALATLLGTHDTFRVSPGEPPGADAAPAAELVERALKLRPDFAVLDRQVDAAAANSHAAAWRWAPSLSAFGNVRAFNYQGFSGDYYSWAVGAQLDWLLYDGGLRDSQRRFAHAQLLEAEARLDLLRDSVTDEVVNARRALITRRRALDAASRSFELSRETLALVRAQYGAGTARQLDLLEAQDSLVASEVAVAQARFDLSLADLLLKKNAGTFPIRSTP